VKRPHAARRRGVALVGGVLAADDVQVEGWIDFYTTWRNAVRARDFRRAVAVCAEEFYAIAHQGRTELRG
jgi:hypothetical protein